MMNYQEIKFYIAVITMTFLSMVLSDEKSANVFSNAVALIFSFVLCLGIVAAIVFMINKISNSK